jgi:hypothetical protein
MKLKLYKVVSKDLKAKDGGNFDYSEYVKSGEFLPEIKDIKECEKGYHVTAFWNMWFDSEDNRIFEVECKGLQENTEIGVKEKYVCSSFKFISEIKVIFDKKLNTGHSNTGDWNTGNSNTGYRNTGDWNTGHSNTGDWNTGNRNTGHSNTGDWNTGNRNTGHRNTGDWNTGNRNTGYWNTGDWNTTNYETGFFNTVENKIIRVFNKEISKRIWDNAYKPNFLYFDLIEGKTYKESFQESFNKINNKNEIEQLLKLPNFNYKVFEKISGITKTMINKKKKEMKA